MEWLLLFFNKGKTTFVGLFGENGGVGLSGRAKVRFLVPISFPQKCLQMCMSVFQKRYKAIYDYAAADEDEVSFADGDVILDVQQIDEGWMFGRVERTGKQGMLPSNYVEAI